MARGKAKTEFLRMTGRRNRVFGAMLGRRFAPVDRRKPGWSLGLFSRRKNGK